MSKYFRLGLIAVIGVSCVLLFLLVLASQNSTFFEKYYTLLLWLNTIIALVFLGLVCVLLYRLYRRAQKKKYGVKILSKFALALGLTGVVPGILIFATSVQFLHTSVESWFDVRVERALDSGLTLGSRGELSEFSAAKSPHYCQRNLRDTAGQLDDGAGCSAGTTGPAGSRAG